MPTRLTRPATSVGRQSSRRPALTLTAALLGFFIVTLDAVVVNVALPTVQRDLDSTISGLQWVVDGYTLMFAAFLLTSGVLSDRIGAPSLRRRRHRLLPDHRRDRHGHRRGHRPASAPYRNEGGNDMTAEASEAIDDAYRAKYSRYGDRYVKPMVAAAAQAATLQVTPRDR